MNTEGQFFWCEWKWSERERMVKRSNKHPAKEQWDTVPHLTTQAIQLFYTTSGRNGLKDSRGLECQSVQML